MVTSGCGATARDIPPNSLNFTGSDTICSWCCPAGGQFLSLWVLRPGLTAVQCAPQDLSLPFYTAGLILVVECLNPVDTEAPQDTEKLEMCVGVNLDGAESVTVEVSSTGLLRVQLKPKVTSAREDGCLLCP